MIPPYTCKPVRIKLFSYCLTYLILSACNSSSENSNSDTTNPHTAPKQINPVSSITLAPHLTELVYSAGGGDSLLGISAYSNYPPAALNKPTIGDAFHLNLEIIKNLKPDVIFYWQNGTPAQSVEQLQNLGFKLQNIEIYQLSDIPKAIKNIAQTLHTQPNELTANFNTTLSRLNLQSKTPQSALIQISDQPIYTVNGKHWMSEAASICGLSNVFSDLSKLSAPVTLESVVLAKPEVIVRTQAFTTENQLKQWSSIPAIANNKIIELNADHFTRPTLRILDAIEVLCEQVNSSK